MNSEPAVDKWLIDSVWMWINWREIKFLEEGVFWVPTPECEMQRSCTWKARS